MRREVTTENESTKGDARTHAASPRRTFFRKQSRLRADAQMSRESSTETDTTPPEDPAGGVRGWRQRRLDRARIRDEEDRAGLDSEGGDSARRTAREDDASREGPPDDPPPPPAPSRR